MLPLGRSSPKVLAMFTNSDSPTRVGAAVPEAGALGVSEGMGFAGHRSDSGRDVGEGGVEVSAGDGRRGVAGEGLRDGVAGDASDAGDGGVAEHVGRQWSPGVPAEVAAGSSEEPVVAAIGDRLPALGPEHGIAVTAATLGNVVEEQCDEGQGGRLFPDRVELLSEPHRGAGWVDVSVAEVEGAFGRGRRSRRSRPTLADLAEIRAGTDAAGVRASASE